MLICIFNLHWVLLLILGWVFFLCGFLFVCFLVPLMYHTLYIAEPLSLSINSSAAPWWIGTSLLIQLTEGREDSFLPAARSYVGFRWEWPNICHLLFILLSSAERGDLVVDGSIGVFNVCVTTYLWSCFALCREGTEVYAMILGDVASSAGRRFSRERKEVMVFTVSFTLDPWYEPQLKAVEQLPNKHQEPKHLLWNWVGEEKTSQVVKNSLREEDKL